MTDSGGRLGVFNLDTPGLNNTPQLEIVNVGNPIVFQWDPFSDKHVLAVGGDCAQVTPLCLIIDIHFGCMAKISLE